MYLFHIYRKLYESAPTTIMQAWALGGLRKRRGVNGHDAVHASIRRGHSDRHHASAGAGAWCLSPSAVLAKDILLRLGKIWITADGRITNARCGAEIRATHARIERAGTASKASSEARGRKPQGRGKPATNPNPDVAGHLILQRTKVPKRRNGPYSLLSVMTSSMTGGRRLWRSGSGRSW